MTPRDPSADDSYPDVALGSLIRQVRDGDTEAYGPVVRSLESRLTSFCVTLLKNRTAAEEVAQEAFIRAYRYLDSFDPERPFYPWLARIAFRLAQSQRSRRRPAEMPPRAEPGHPADRPSPLDDLIRDERSRSLWKEVWDLPAGERASVVLYYRQDLSVREVADALGVTSGTVKTFLFRARRHLKQRLTALDRGEDG
jgi:RNA polymerase sigma-70 factor (ECF subfamily)